MRRTMIAAAAILLLAGTSAQAAGTLRIGMQDDPDALDPAQGEHSPDVLCLPAYATS